MPQRKMSVEEYLEREFTFDSRPCHKTVVTWIKKGIIPGVELGGKYWVYEQTSVADLLVEKVLRAS